MLHYEKLPRNTPLSVVLGILIVGLGLSYSIVASSLVAIYVLIGLLGGYFYANSEILISKPEAVYLGILLLAAAITAVMLSFLAYYMNTLSKKTHRLSRVMWLPAMLTSGLVSWQHSSAVFSNHIGTSATAAVAMIIPLGGILPAIFLSTQAARKVHKR